MINSNSTRRIGRTAAWIAGLLLALSKQEARQNKAECKQTDGKSNAECRQDKRDTKQEGRQEKRDIKR